MAAATTNGESSAALDELKPPSGVVLPPREIRNILEKTAGYVARNGAIFEDRIRDKESANPKFSFLNPADAYHAFYQWRLAEIKSGRGTDVAAGRAGEAAAEPEKPKGPPKPPDFEFSARMPRINQKDLEVIRLTALFVAKNGRQFMTQLAQRETGNPQFQFLIPNHTFHNFFQHLIDQYTTLIRAAGLDGEGGKLQEEKTAELERNVNDKYCVLTRARQRADYAKFQELERQKKEEEEEKKKEEFSRIDWGDFVVVETITFTEADETANLPPPTNLSELQYASLEDRNKASLSMLRIEEAMPGEEFSVGSGPAVIPYAPSPVPPQPSYGAQQPAQTYSQPGQMPAVQAPPNGYQPQRSSQEEEEARRIQERADAQARIQQAQSEARGGAPPMKIRENYVPRAAQRGKQAGQTALCPNCKQQIPINELEAHMRIELLDPRWKEQKAAAESRYSATITGSEIAQNLKRLASQRNDVFDPATGQAMSEDELARRKKAALNPADAQQESKPQAMNPQTVNVEEQIRAIHQKFAGDRK
ncbi:SURP and pre-mRNA splicing factor PRP21-like domain protein [Metarhizium robertsii]|uniref:Pre-mRNA-splicing factor sap114 n=2 Tax=Metarhizium robertsii TaxID=568076 RepID=E9FDL4_METRA|nr:pre-mRNA-splicing factor sap114 [Metarhizium robertsii ARSEF 23]EFY94172.1 pre-mRNA-splicing factor sap114 [Metarhizium robertsii ARSEF 23]EXU95488.1 SURP and pre-mRNA splicing factor PRP21-like domain protein [Metarhizium robertsii]